MLYGLSGAPCPDNYPPAQMINLVCQRDNFFPCILGAVAWVETLEVMSYGASQSFISVDGGHGTYQLTASYPENWQDPYAAAEYAILNFLAPALDIWAHDYHLTGDSLARAVFATYNAGLGGALRGHLEGNVGLYTTSSGGVSYPDRALAAYHKLGSGELPGTLILD